MKNLLIAIVIVLFSYSICFANSIKENSPEGRLSYAKAKEQQMLDDGYDMYFEAKDEDYKTLEIRWIFTGRVYVNKMINKDKRFIKMLKQKYGFTKVIFSGRWGQPKWVYDLIEDKFVDSYTYKVEREELEDILKRAKDELKNK